MTRFPLLACVLAVLCAAAPLAATPWTPDDLLDAQTVRGLELSDDGRIAVWIRRSTVRLDGERKTVNQAFLARLDETDRPPVQLTHDPAGVGAMALSPDARHLAFLTTRERAGVQAKGPQLWVLPLDGGEAYGVTSFDRPVADFAWIDDGSFLVARDAAPSGRERRLEQAEDTSIAVDDVRDTPPVRLWRVDLDGTAKRLTTNDDWIEEMAVAPNGRQAVIRAGQSLTYDFDSRVPPRTFLIDLDTGERTEILAGTRYLPEAMQWSDDSAFYFVDRYTRHPVYRMATVARLHRYDVATGQTRRVDAEWERGLGGDFFAIDGGIAALLADGARHRPAVLTIAEQSVTRGDLDGEHMRHVDEMAVSRDGARILYESSTPDRPPQLFTARLDGRRVVDVRQLTKLNPSWSKKPVGRSEVIRWSGAEGDEVEGVLHYPLSWQDGTRAPLVLDIHGGPAGVDRDNWSSTFGSPNILWRQRGAFVLQVNYHGSANYGLDWVESIRERYYELELPDIETGVDHLIELGLVDPERLAVTGWSNGGILAAALVVETDRYRAAVVGAADVEWISDWGNVDFGASFDNYYFGGPPWERLEHYIEKSPFFRLDQVTTPVLVHTGDRDRAVPTHQSWSLFRALQYLGNIEVRFLLYPDEPHGLRKWPHRQRRLEEDLAWLDRHLFDEHDPVDDALPEDSLLASRIERDGASRVGDAFGVEMAGVLVPETIPTPEGVGIGRFEVTRAQWAAYRSGDEMSGPNLPVTGVSFDEARAYVAWLTEQTGQTWRLPTADEAEGWAGDGGNVLDHWVGYKPNVDDAARLRERLTASGVSLVRSVGAGSGKTLVPGGQRVFDVDGNVAEWAVDGETGRAVGPSAERASGSNDDPAPDYVGVRVVREP